MNTSAIIPAHNEEATISKIVWTILPHVDEVIVVDSCSTDRTAEFAVTAGANVESTKEPGKHIALHKGVSSAKGDLIVFMDGDIQNPSRDFVTKPLKLLYENNMASIVKGYYTRPFHNSPHGGGRLTELCARPLLALFFPELSFVRQPLSGEFAVRRKYLSGLNFAPGYAVDIGILIDCSRKGLVLQVDLGTKEHKHRDILCLGQSAVEVAATILSRVGNTFTSIEYHQFLDNQILKTFINLEEIPIGGNGENERNQSHNI